MKDRDKTKTQLIAELAEMRRRYAMLEAEHGQTGHQRDAARAAPRESEQQYRSLLDGVPIGLYRTMPTGQVVDANLALVEMLGYPDREALLALNVADLYVDAQERARWQVQMEREGIVRGYETQLRRRDGTVIWARDTAHALLDEEGQPLCYQGSLEDITERVRAQALLEESEARLRALFENSGYAMGVSREGLHVMVNPAYLDLYGYDHDTELIGKPILDIIAPEHRAQILENMRRRAKGDPVPLFYETRGLRKDGSTLDLDVQVSTYELGGEIYTVVILRDITERVWMETALRESEARFRTLIEHAPDAILTIDMDTVRIVDANKNAERLFGLTREELSRVGPAEISPPTQPGGRPSGEMVGEWIQQILDGHVPSFEWVHRNAAGDDFPCEVRLVRLPAAERNLLRASITDITERSRAEAALRVYAERLEVLHEIDQRILAARSAEEIAQVAASRVRRLIPCQRAGITLFDFTLNEALILAVDVNGETKATKGTRVSLDRAENMIEEARRGQLFTWKEVQSQSRAELMSQANGLRSYIGVPLVAQGELVGSLNLGMDNPDALTPEHLDIARQVADQLAIAIQQTRLYEQVQHHAEEMEQRVADRTRELAVLYEIAAIASQPLDLETALARSLETVLAAARGSEGLIHLLGEEKAELRLAVQRGLPPEIMAQITSLPSDWGLGAVIEGRGPLVVHDIASDPRMPIALPIPPRTYIGMPMHAHGQPVGVLSILGEATQLHLSVEGLSLLSSVADEVGMLVESARLRQQAERAAALEERARLARELHDSVTQSLYSVTLFAESGRELAQKGQMKRLEGCLEDLNDTALQALKEMRLLVYELRPSTPAQEGLVGALQQRLDAVEGRTGVKTRLLLDGTVALSPGVEQELYRIAQEALNNALKHANASSVTVHIRVSDGQVELSITDNGQGFDPKAADHTVGMGLRSMRERAEGLGGSFALRSAPGEGTEIKISVQTQGNS